MPPREDADEPFKSSLGMRYPTLRDYPIRDGAIWLESKKLDDGYGDLWRVHDGLYDLSGFIKKHPGGPEWLRWTQGTDVTELFEVHHISTKAEKLLPKFFVRKAETPRDAPFHFKEDGFYKTFKREVREIVKDLPKWPVILSKVYIDSLLIGYLLSATLAAMNNSYLLATLAGLLFGCLGIAGHNFMHQRNNFRMYYMNLCFMSWREWRLTHVISHHVLPNTINDVELTVLEPFDQFLPTKKSPLYLRFAWWIQPIYYALFFPLGFITLMVHKILWKIGVIPYRAPLYWDDFLPFVVLIPMSLASNLPFEQILLLFLYITMVGGMHFGIIGINAAHRDPEIFLDGDAPRPKEELDWGIHQIDTIVDRKDVSKHQFTVLTAFGDHALHHMFPTLDHGLLRYLYPLFNKNCEKFGVKLLFKTHWEVMKAHFQQLLRTEPKKEPPKPLLTTSSKKTE